MDRGYYGEIAINTLAKQTRKTVEKLVSAAGGAKKVDEHGSWEFGIEMDRKGRGMALNWDLYGVGRDYHDRRMLIVIQVREYEKRSIKAFPRIRKNYFLIGRNEDDTVFAHPVPAQVVRRAVRDNANVIQRVQRWIFGTDYQNVIRQGDLALVPKARRPGGGEHLKNKIVLEESHVLEADEIIQNKNLYAKNPVVQHTPGVHPDRQGSGWYKIVIGKRSNFWKFAAPTAD